MKGRKEGREGGGKEIKEERKWKGRMKGKRGGGKGKKKGTGGNDSHSAHSRSFDENLY